MKHKHLIKALAFSLIFILLFSYATQVVTVSSEDNEYQWISGIYHEPENSLDAVYIGSSNCYAFWNSNYAWNEYGIAVYPFTCSTMSLLTAEYVVKEARKTQPDAVYVVNINTFREEDVSRVAAHRLLDFMPLSINKLKLTHFLCDIKDLSIEDRLEYYFPMIRYHEKWDELEESNFSTELNGLKGADTRRWALKNIYDVSDIYVKTDEYGEISDLLRQTLGSLLDYCEEENVRIVFVTVPRAEEDEKYLSQINTINKLISDRGFPTVDLSTKADELHIDLETDYYNENHTNVHGAIKFTDYIANYLLDEYKFEDKRNDEEYVSWNESFEEYSKIIAPYVPDFELDISHRDFEIERPESLKAKKESGKNVITWSQVENADGYTLYKKTGNKAWTAISSTEDTSFTDTDIKSGNSYSYTVVPYRTQGGEKMYGNYLYNGIEVKVS